MLYLLKLFSSDVRPTVVELHTPTREMRNRNRLGAPVTTKELSIELKHFDIIDVHSLLKPSLRGTKQKRSLVHQCRRELHHMLPNQEMHNCEGISCCRK